LPVPVNAADALLQARRVERDVQVDQAVTVVLQVDALTRGIACVPHERGRLGGVWG
jgi:hypothetical protein